MEARCSWRSFTVENRCPKSAKCVYLGVKKTRETQHPVGNFGEDQKERASPPPPNTISVLSKFRKMLVFFEFSKYEKENWYGVGGVGEMLVLFDSPRMRKRACSLIAARIWFLRDYKCSKIFPIKCKPRRRMKMEIYKKNRTFMNPPRDGNFYSLEIFGTSYIARKTKTGWGRGVVFGTSCRAKKN